MTSKFKYSLRIILSIGLLVLLSGCEMPLIHPKGMIAKDERDLIIIATLLMLIVVLPVIVMTLTFAWKYRATNSKAKYTPDWEHSTTLEAIWWAIPCVIIGILGVITWRTSHELDPYKSLDIQGKKPLVIQVVALDWKWLFIYPEQHIATINWVQMPVDTPIEFKVTADAPMNSFWIPAIAGQIYAMAGMDTQLHVIGNEIGDYRGMSSNYSGAGFSDMKFTARISTGADFEQWVKQVLQSPEHLTLNVYNNIAKPSENNKVQYFSSVEDDLYHDIIMKFMMPMDHMDNNLTHIQQ